MAVVAPGIYLEENRPARSQFRAKRRSPIRSVIVVHTAESGTDFVGVDQKAENVARFIRDRKDPGSYHLIGDADSIIQLVRFDAEAYQDGTGSNRWAIGISLAVNAADWPKMTAARRLQFVDTAAQMAAIAARWLQSQGLPAPHAVQLSRADSDRPDACGFISHGRRDPTRRSDPGPGFPWDRFFERYRAYLNQTGGLTVADLTALETQTMDLQRLLISWGVDLGESGPNDDGVDGDPGEVTVRGATDLLRHLIHELDQARKNTAGSIDPDQVRIWKSKEAKLERIQELSNELRQLGIL